MAILDLFIVASMPVLKLLLITGLGAYLALDHINIMGEDSRKYANNIVFYVFNPALICSSLARTITYDNIVKLWFMPFNILLTFMVGSVLGWVVIHMTRPPSHLRGLIIGCCSAGNMGTLFLIIIPAVCKEKGSPFGDPDVCYDYALAYASLSMAVSAIFLWSYVYNIVQISGNNSLRGIPITKQGDIEEPLLLGKEQRVSEYDDVDDQSCTIFERKPQMSIVERVKQCLEKLNNKINLKIIFAPSTTGAIVGFVIALVPQIKWLLIGDEAPLHVIQDSASQLGDVTIPALTLIVGGNLLRGLKETRLEKSIVVGIIIVRYIMMPVIGIGIVKVTIHFGIVHPSPLYQFVLLLQYALPPALNIGTITQLFGAGERECSVIMLWTYVLASVSLTLWCTIFMWLVAP